MDRSRPSHDEAPRAEAGQRRPEAEQRRLDRQLSEVLQELRVAMPGVQLLFGFLLVVPFNQRFAEVSAVQRDVYGLTLLSAAVSSALFIAPAAYHRLLFQRGDKPRIIAFATRCALGGLAALAVAMTGAVWFVTSFVFSAAMAVGCTTAVVFMFAWLWFGAAWIHRGGRGFGR